MKAQILYGNDIASALRDKIKHEIELRQTLNIPAPCLAVILVGKDRASEIYVNNKKKSCQEVGIKSLSFNLPKDATTNELLNLLEKLNTDNLVNGILVQLPLPEHMDKTKIIEKISVIKDVDGFHPYNIGRLAQGIPILRPCTPYGIIQMLETIKQNFVGINATVIGTSNIVGRPMAFELLYRKATVTLCHQFTQNLPEIIKNSELLIVAVGKPALIKATWIKPNSTIIDVGINRLNNGKIVGDVEFDKACQIAKYITPVPGGVGPMTIVTLLQNTLTAQKLQLSPSGNLID